jgi:hypothetical protein
VSPATIGTRTWATIVDLDLGDTVYYDADQPHEWVNPDERPCTFTKLPAQHVNDVWTYDFISIRLADASKLRMLSVLDEYSRWSSASSI